MAKTRKKNPNGPPTQERTTQFGAANPEPEPQVSAAFEGAPTEGSERIAGTESDEAWAPQSTGDTAASEEGRDRIAARAYELYLERGASGGDAMQDWLEAEREFSNKDRGSNRSRE